MGREAADRLVIAYDAATTSVFALNEAAAGLAEIIWLVDLSDAVMARSARLLRRMGTVVDVAGRSVTQTIDVLRPVGPTGIMAVTDSHLGLLAAIAAGLDLDFHSPAVAERLSDKQVQRQALREAGVAVPQFLGDPGNTRPTAGRGLGGGGRVSRRPQTPAGRRKPKGPAGRRRRGAHSVHRAP